MSIIQQLLGEKENVVWSIAPNASVYEAISEMAERGIGALPVMERDQLVGIISERDYARKVILNGRASQCIKVEEIMTRDVVCASLAQSVNECLSVMTDRRVRHLPVVDEGKVIGMLSIGDLVKATMAEQRQLITQLEQYIRG